MSIGRAGMALYSGYHRTATPAKRCQSHPLHIYSVGAVSSSRTCHGRSLCIVPRLYPYGR